MGVQGCYDLIMAEEAWLRGPIDGVDPLISPVLYTFIQAREDIAKWTEGFAAEQLWSTKIGFHIRHIAGSVDRLMTYLEGRQLSDAQMARLRAEDHPGASRDELLAELDDAVKRAEAVVRALDASILHEPRHVGRKRLPTTVIGLLTHIAEHTQRHVGQIVTLAKYVQSPPFG